jgi:hypothetical protein
MARDLRRYRSQTNRRLLIGFFFLVFLVGDGLIYLLMGREAAAMGMLCILGVLVPVALVWLILAVMGWIVKKAEGE